MVLCPLHEFSAVGTCKPTTPLFHIKKDIATHVLCPPYYTCNF